MRKFGKWKPSLSGTINPRDLCRDQKSLFLRNMFEMSNLPKTVLINWTRKNNYPHPTYKTEATEKSFRSVVMVDRKRYSSTYL